MPHALESIALASIVLLFIGGVLGAVGAAAGPGTKDVDFTTTMGERA